jgi:hypothetical protein
VDDAASLVVGLKHKVFPLRETILYQDRFAPVELTNLAWSI